jgi:GAF domain-containing protein
MERDTLVQENTDRLRDNLAVDRVVIYHFFREWEGRVTYESLSLPQFSILGSTGPDECFNNEYAAMYRAGRIRAIADIETEEIADCHREFLQNLGVRANLAAPILTLDRLWGLLVAHHCQSIRPWSAADIELVSSTALMLATAPSIRDR